MSSRVGFTGDPIFGIRKYFRNLCFWISFTHLGQFWSESSPISFIIVQKVSKNYFCPRIFLGSLLGLYLGCALALTKSTIWRRLWLHRQSHSHSHSHSTLQMSHNALGFWTYSSYSGSCSFWFLGWMVFFWFLGQLMVGCPSADWPYWVGP